MLCVVCSNVVFLVPRFVFPTVLLTCVSCRFATDIVVRSFATTAVDPFPQLLLAPALAIPRALDLAGVWLSVLCVFLSVL